MSYRDKYNAYCEAPAGWWPQYRTVTLTPLSLVVALLGYWATAMSMPAIVGTAGVGLAFLALLYHRQASRRWLDTAGKAVLVTGCDTGFGHHLALTLAKRGITVFAGCLDAESDDAAKLHDLDLPNLHVLQMDVTDDVQIQDCVDYVQKHVGETGLWGVVNNAGLNIQGDVEIMHMAMFEKLVNTNQLGMVRVTKALLPLIRTAVGRVVNVTSVKGRLSVPYNGGYGMTKFAGETFSDILRMEMTKFGVRVSIIEPCNFGGATGCLDLPRLKRDFDAMWESMSPALRETYGRDYVDHQLTDATAQIPTAQFNLYPVIHAMMTALFAASPKERYLVKGGQKWFDIYWLRAHLAHFLPDWYMDSILLAEWKHFPLPRSLRK